MTAAVHDTAAIAATTDLLNAAIAQEGIGISGDMRIGEKDAARLLGYAAGHLKAMRQEGRGPVFYQRGVYGSRVSYRIVDLAAWIEAARER
jgi:hypothetical protein